MGKVKKFREVTANSVQPNDVVWLKDASTEDLTVFIDALTARGLDMVHVGPRDRWRVVAKVVNHE